MKFEHVLQIYWSKGFLMSGQLQSFHTSFHKLFIVPKGSSVSTKTMIISRFEQYTLVRHPTQPIYLLGTLFTLGLNTLFSQIANINASTTELVKQNCLRLYLIKTTRGRSHALGKPSRGQRTWSNAWTAYHSNTVIRLFIGAHQSTHHQNYHLFRKNYKLIQKKSLRRQRKKAISSVVYRSNNWF
jgi:ribosomal protein S13